MSPESKNDGLGLIDTGAEIKEQLPFSEVKQLAFFGHLLTNEQWFLQCVEVIKPTWFLDFKIGNFWKIAQAHYVKNRKIPTLPELFEDTEFRKEEQSIKNKTKILIEEAKAAALEYRLHTFGDEITAWMKALKFQEGMTKSLNLYNHKQPEKAYLVLDEYAKDIRQVSFQPRQELSFLHPELQVANAAIERTGALTLGHKLLDDKLLPGNEGGSLLRRDTTIIVAPTGAGKTTHMVTVACSNVLKKKDVLLLIHEGNQLDIYEKIFCCMMGLTKVEYHKAVTDPTPPQAEKLASVSKILARYLRFHPMLKAGLCVEEVGAVVSQMQIERIAKYGKGFDLVIDDYVAKLSSDRLARVTKREIDEYTYNYMARLAEENNFHLLTAIQTNRTGSRINKGQKGYDDRLLTHEDVMESFGAMTVAANILTINRDTYSEGAGFVTYYISKTRTSEIGWAVICRSQYSVCRSHWNTMAAMCYRGNVPLGSQIEILANRFVDGQMVPRELFG